MGREFIIKNGKLELSFEEDCGEDGEILVTILVPYRNEVCGRCNGEGSHLTPSIGQHAYSQEEFDEAFSDDEDREQYFTRGGIYDVACEECGGKRIVPVVDESSIDRWDPVTREYYGAYVKREEDRARDEAEDRAIRRMENGGYDG